MNNNTNVEKILKKYKENLPQPKPGWPSTVRQAVNYIHSHLFDVKLTVRKMKKKYIINGSNFSGIFKYYVGKRPKTYWIEHRIGVAKLLLKEHTGKDISIMSIALSVGFNRHSTFTKAFKRTEKVTPTTYQNKFNK